MPSNPSSLCVLHIYFDTMQNVRSNEEVESKFIYLYLQLFLLVDSIHTGLSDHTTCDSLKFAIEI